MEFLMIFLVIVVLIGVIVKFQKGFFSGCFSLILFIGIIICIGLSFTGVGAVIGVPMIMVLVEVLVKRIIK